MYWKPGWEFRDINETRQMVVEAAQTDAWVFDGNNSSTFSERADRAELIIFLDMPTWLRVCRVIRRTIFSFGQSRPDMADGCPERFEWGFTKWVLGYYFNGGRERALKLIETYTSSCATYQFTSPKEVVKFLNSLQD